MLYSGINELAERHLLKGMFLFQTFILQLEGKTKWKLFKPLQELPQEASPDLELSDLGEPKHEFDMQVSEKAGACFQEYTPVKINCDHTVITEKCVITPVITLKFVITLP